MVDWLEKVSKRDQKAAEKCYAQIQMLKAYGNKLRRPYADYLRNGIYELRVSSRRVQYRILYFFHGQNLVILSHGLIKEGKVPVKEINKAIDRKLMLESNPAKHTWIEGV